MVEEQKFSVEGLGDIPETLLIPLRGRYLETKRTNGIIRDPRSIEILDHIAYDFSRHELSTGTQVGVAVRTLILDREIRAFLDVHDKAVVVNLGCGLDTRCHRLDNGRVQWFDLDVEETIELRRHFFPENDRYTLLARSVLDFEWCDEIPTDRPVLIIAEGLLMYFEEEEVRRILTKLGERFPGAGMFFEAICPWMARHTDLHPDVKLTNAKFKWGLATGRDLDAWFDSPVFVAEWFSYDLYRDRWPMVLRVASSVFRWFNNCLKIVQLRFPS